MTNNISPPGWYQDPTGQGDGRYWNGSSWTQAVDRGGVTVNVPIDPSMALIPPLAGTQVAVPTPPPAPPMTQATTSNRSPLGIIVGVLVVVVIAVLVFVLVSNDSSDTPTPGTDAPPATPAPAAEDG